MKRLLLTILLMVSFATITASWGSDVSEEDARPRKKRRVIDVANAILAQKSMCHLSLQKTLYYVEGHLLAEEDTEFDERVERWHHGMVYPDVFNYFKGFTTNIYQEFSYAPTSSSENSPNDFAVIVGTYALLRPTSLEDFNHQEPLWQGAKPNQNISKDEIKRSFQQGRIVKKVGLLSNVLKTKPKNVSQIQEVYSHFSSLDDNSPEWKEYFARLLKEPYETQAEFVALQKWPFQSWKEAVGAALFFPPELISTLDNPDDLIGQVHLIERLKLAASFKDPLSLFYLLSYLDKVSTPTVSKFYAYLKKSYEDPTLETKPHYTMMRISQYLDENTFSSILLDSTIQDPRVLLEAALESSDPEDSKESDLKELSDKSSPLALSKLWLARKKSAKQPTEAYSLFMESGNLGCPQGFCEASYMIQNGQLQTEGVPLNLFLKAANLGSPEAIRAASKIMDQKAGLTGDYKEYEEFLNEHLYDPFSYFLLGELYEKTFRPKDDIVSAYSQSGVYGVRALTALGEKQKAEEIENKEQAKKNELDVFVQGILADLGIANE